MNRVKLWRKDHGKGLPGPRWIRLTCEPSVPGSAKPGRGGRRKRRWRARAWLSFVERSTGASSGRMAAYTDGLVYGGDVGVASAGYRARRREAKKRRRRARAHEEGRAVGPDKLRGRPWRRLERARAERAELQAKLRAQDEQIARLP